MHAPALRPRSAIEIVDASFAILRKSFVQMAIIGLAAAAPLVVLVIVGGAAAVGVMKTQLASSPAVAIPLLFVATVLALIWVAIVDGAVTIAAGDAYFGRELSPASALRTAFSRAMPLLGAYLLRALIIGALALVAGVVVFAMSKMGGFFAVIAGIAAAVLVIHVALRLFATTSVVVFEDVGASESVNRSFALSKDSALRIFGVLFLCWLIVNVLQYAFNFTVAALLSSLLDSPMVAMILMVVVAVLLYPFLNIAIMVLYYDQRVRKEGYDLQMMSSAIPASPVSPSPSAPSGAPTSRRIR